MNRPPLTDPRRNIEVVGFFPSTALFQTPSRSRSATGGMTAVTWEDVAGMTEVPAIVSGISTTEQKSPDAVTAKSSHIVGLAGWYPNVEVTWRVIINNDAYDIISVEHDELGTRTQLHTQILSNSAVAGQ